MSTRDSACRLGVLAFGDSITNGGGELQWGVALQSWALWTARGLGLPYSPYAVDGATSAAVVQQQLPAYERTVADPGTRYQLGCLYIGTNDLRRPGFDLDQYAADLEVALAFLRGRCDRLLTATIPLDMGRPRNPELIERVNVTIEAEAARHGALVLDLRRFGGRRVMMADHVHPTALGQVAIARLALARLAAEGLPTRVDPATLAVPAVGGRARLRADITYAYRHLKQNALIAIARRRHRAGGA
jgi:lysophospholipase L1-like esterase